MSADLSEQEMTDTGRRIIKATRKIFGLLERYDLDTDEAAIALTMVRAQIFGAIKEGDGVEELEKIRSDLDALESKAIEKSLAAAVMEKEGENE